MAWKDQGWRADTEGMSPSDDAPLLWGPCSSLPKTPPGLPARRPTLAPTQGSGIHSSTTAAGRLPPGPKGSGGSRVCLPGASRLPERERACTGCGRLPSFLPAGLFQELVLLRGDPHRVMPRAEWHLPAEGAAELPLAHELPWEQVSETVWIRSCCGRRAGAGAGGKPGTPRVGGQRARCPFPGTCPWLLGQPGGLPGGGFPHSSTHLYSVSVHGWRTGQPSSQGLPVQLFS